MSFRHPVLKCFTRKAIIIVLGLSGACSTQYSSESTDLVSLPKTWQSDISSEAEKLDWSSLVNSPELTPLIQAALQSNLSLAQRRLDIDIAKASLFRSKMRFIPELDVSFAANRQAIVTNGGTGNQIIGSNNDFALRADFRYEVNLWGQVSDAKKVAAYNYAAIKADYESQQRSTVTQVASAWALLIEGQQIEALRASRLSSLENNLAIIQGGFRKGLNTALEVYLARNNVERERALYIQSSRELSDARRDLALLLGDYPHQQLQAPDHFPDVSSVLPSLLPSEVLMRRPDLQSAWLAVLSQNSTLAVAHKARFPSLALNAGTNVRSAELSDLLDNALSWNIGGSLIQPLLSAGRLKSEELSQSARLKQTELRYQELVYAAFSEVESALQRQGSLATQYLATQQASDNALQAETLSFEQYLKGLVSFTTVLDAQRSAVDAQLSLISLKRQLFINTVTLHEVLAGEFDFIADAAIQGH